MYRQSFLYLTFLLLFAASTLPASAQAPLPGALWRVEETKTNTDTYFYFYINPGMPTIRVQMLGAVRAPGLYEVGEETDLGQLVALAGGPIVTARARRSRLEIGLKVFRPTPVGQEIIFDNQFEFPAANATTYPPLMDGDVVMMDVVQRQRISWRDVTSIVSTIGILALSYERLSRASR